MARTLDNPDTLEATLYMPGNTVTQIPYVPTREDFKYMDIALDEARIALREGNVPIGAVFATSLLRKKQIYRAHSTEITDDDLDAHAERNAYTQCQAELGRDLSSVAAYITSEPCDGCAHRFVQGHIGKIVYAADYDDAPDFFRARSLSLDTKLRDAGRTILVVRGLRKPEALELMVPANKVH